MDLRKLKTLIDLVSESSISELEITEADGKVRIVKASAPAPVAAVVAAPVPVAAAAAPLAGPTGQAPAPAPTAAAATTPTDEGKVIRSPMVGTFYRAASPGAKPFIETGDVVKEGTPVCIIEAMKIMNEIESDLAGTVVRVLCENGQAVEYGQPLFILE